MQTSFIITVIVNIKMNIENRFITFANKLDNMISSECYYIFIVVRVKKGRSETRCIKKIIKILVSRVKMGRKQKT